ncbi:maleylpyruvate isomerase N-terminal domain-containing protein [Nocardioides sp. SYSU DS0651]|uniref:maleylpyruvate isomerase N-terminal domain-containing protein n=1 Tax=Nocardioides sp. SYSU DS0651 TaxID=3415955 RepID=UPI003F4B12B1
MRFPWDTSVTAFVEGAQCFVRTTALVGDRWNEPGLGEWDVRSLVGHTSRSFITVEEYLARPAEAVAVEDPAAYYLATREIAAGAGVAQRGRDAGVALGEDPAAGVAAIAERVVPLLDACDGTELVTTIAGGMRLGDYLPTRAFELAVHTADLAAALGVTVPLPVPTAAQALAIVADLAAVDGVASELLLAVTGRRGLPDGFSLL